MKSVLLSLALVGCGGHVAAPADPILAYAEEVCAAVAACPPDATWAALSAEWYADRGPHCVQAVYDRTRDALGNVACLEEHTAALTGTCGGDLPVCAWWTVCGDYECTTRVPAPGQ